MFDDAYPIEAYVENFEGYGDNTTITYQNLEFKQLRK
jgi:hypothetical protein